jgi:hypothetical protein
MKKGLFIAAIGWVMLWTVACGKKEPAEVLDPAVYGVGKTAKLCPVSKDAMGSMGKPVELTLSNGKKMMFCCAGCKKSVEKDQKKYAAFMY